MNNMITHPGIFLRCFVLLHVSSSSHHPCFVYSWTPVMARNNFEYVFVYFEKLIALHQGRFVWLYFCRCIYSRVFSLGFMMWPLFFWFHHLSWQEQLSIPLYTFYQTMLDICDALGWKQRRNGCWYAHMQDLPTWFDSGGSLILHSKCFLNIMTTAYFFEDMCVFCFLWPRVLTFETSS